MTDASVGSLMSGVTSELVETGRLGTHVLSRGPEDATPVVFIHGNASSGRFFEETLAALPEGYRGIAPDLRGFGGSEVKPVDATRGVADFAEDLMALSDALELGRGGRKMHLVGWSVGGTVALRYAMERPQDLASITLVNPMSPYGFGGTRDASGTPCYEDFAGSGGGTANPEFVARLAAKDRGEDDPNSPRNVMNSFYFAPPFRAPREREEVYLSSMLSTRTGEDNYPGDATVSENWPGAAPGERGMNNAISPRHCDLSAFAEIASRPPVLWVRGTEDRIVSDASLLDFGTLGAMGAVPGWPGEEVFPSQPMVSQIRSVLARYAAEGGSYLEEVFEGCGHSPHVERPEEFQRLLFEFLGRSPAEEGG